MVVEIDLRGSDPRSQAELKQALNECMRDWPGVAPKRVACRHLPESVYGATNNMPHSGFDPGEYVTVNEDVMRDYTRWQEDIHLGRLLGISSFNSHVSDFVEQHPAMYTIEHEFGHVLFGHIYGSGATQQAEDMCNKSLILAWNALNVKDAPHDMMLAPLVPMAFCFGIGREEITKDLSPYAATNPMELIAEAFAVQRVLGKGHSKVADAVMRQLRQDYEIAFGHVNK